MQCVSLCLVIFGVIAVNGYPQRVTLVGIGDQSDFYNPYRSYNFPRRASSGSISSDESTGKDIFSYPGWPRIDEEDTGKDGVGFPSVSRYPYDSTDLENPGFYSPTVIEIMRSLQETLRRLREEMDAVIKRLPEQPNEHDSDDEVFTLGHNFGDIKNKSTSETKVIDGQQVTVNETVLSKGDYDGGVIFRVKTIFVRPTEPPTSETGDEVTDSVSSTEISEPESTPETKVTPEPIIPEREPIPERGSFSNDNTENNDIPIVNDKIQKSEWETEETELIPIIIKSNELKDIQSSNEVEPFDNKPAAYHDLSRDTLVNDYMSDQHQSQGLVMINPDAEFIDINKDNTKHNEYYRYESQPVEKKEEYFEAL